jgi:nitroimidazol reductase NimA-like FMN-containing flavoprotein (pyridoxamine 5'-phosphate oxidase superfamily)
LALHLPGRQADHSEVKPDSLSALTHAECLEFLRLSKVGRIVFTIDALPAIMPVNFALDGDSIVFRTTANSRLARATDGAVVAFEVDEIDELQRTGWSVVVLGVADAVRDVGSLVRMQQLNLLSWVAGVRAHYVRITPAQITGRRLLQQALTPTESPASRRCGLDP